MIIMEKFSVNYKTQLLIRFLVAAVVTVALQTSPNVNTSSMLKITFIVTRATMGMKCMRASTNGPIPSSPPFHAAQHISIIQGQRFNCVLFFCTGSCARWSSRWCCPQTCPPIYSKSKPSKPVYSSKSGNSVPQFLWRVKRSLNDEPVRDTEPRKRGGCRNGSDPRYENAPTCLILPPTGLTSPKHCLCYSTRPTSVTHQSPGRCTLAGQKH